MLVAVVSGLQSRKTRDFSSWIVHTVGYSSVDDDDDDIDDDNDDDDDDDSDDGDADNNDICDDGVTDDYNNNGNL